MVGVGVTGVCKASMLYVYRQAGGKASCFRTTRLAFLRLCSVLSPCPPLVVMQPVRARWFLQTPSAGPTAVHRKLVGRSGWRSEAMSTST